jgi:hypothetical protein
MAELTGTVTVPSFVKKVLTPTVGVNIKMRVGLFRLAVLVTLVAFADEPGWGDD